jgi:amino acid transporter
MILRHFLSRRITGWINLLGQVAGVASSEYGAAQMLLAAVAIGKDFDYVIDTDTTIGVMVALTVLTGVVNSLSTYWMEKMTKTYVIFHVLILISCSIALLVLTDNKHSASYVFTDVEPTSGWSPVGFSFLFGFLSVSWTMTDYDATAHITEEINQPEIKAPWAISMAMLFTYLAGFLFNIVLCFCMVRISISSPCLDDTLTPYSGRPCRDPRQPNLSTSRPDLLQQPRQSRRHLFHCCRFNHHQIRLLHSHASAWPNSVRLLP